MADREIEKWVTINGVHIPVYKGESSDDAVKRVDRNIKTVSDKKDALGGNKADREYKNILAKHVKEGTHIPSAEETAKKVREEIASTARKEKGSELRQQNQKREDELKTQIKQLERNAFNKDARVVLSELRARLDEHNKYESGKYDISERQKEWQAKEKSLLKNTFNSEARSTIKEVRARLDEINKILQNEKHY